MGAQHARQRSMTTRFEALVQEKGAGDVGQGIVQAIERVVVQVGSGKETRGIVGELPVPELLGDCHSPVLVRQRRTPSSSSTRAKRRSERRISSSRSVAMGSGA